MSALLSLITGSKLMVPIMAALAAVAMFFGGRMSERKSAQIKDLKNAKDLRNRVDEVEDDYSDLDDVALADRLRDARERTGDGK